MRLTAQEVFDKLIYEDKICELEGRITFYMGAVTITVRQRDVVGNIMQEWLQGWLDKNGIEAQWRPCVPTSIGESSLFAEHAGIK